MIDIDKPLQKEHQEFMERAFEKLLGTRADPRFDDIVKEIRAIVSWRVTHGEKVRDVYSGLVVVSAAMAAAICQLDELDDEAKRKRSVAYATEFAAAILSAPIKEVRL